MEPEKIDLLSKGKFLKGDDKLLIDLRIENGQTIMILEKNLEETKKSFYNKENLDAVKGIFPDLDDSFIKYVLESESEKLENVILVLTDEERRKNLFKSYSSQTVEQIKVSPNDSMKYMLLEKLCGLELYSVLFKLLNLKSEDIQKRVLKVLKMLPPYKELVDSVLKESNNFGSYIDILKQEQTREEKLSELRKKEAAKTSQMSDFNLLLCVVEPHCMNLYKFEIFTAVFSIITNKDDIVKIDNSFDVQKQFIENGGVELIGILLPFLMERYFKKPNPFLYQAMIYTTTLLSNYTFTFYLINTTDPKKKSRQLFVKRRLKTKKDSYMDISLKRNNSTDNVFSQKMNASFKTNKSPKSFTTPDFQSPSWLTRYISFSFLKVTEC